MEISFTRSGGFAGRATNVSGTVHFSDGRSHVSAEGTDYARDLTSEEVDELRGLANASLTGRANAAGPSSERDGFQYNVVLHTADGKKHSLAFAALGVDASAAPTTFSEWVEREAQRIWDHRLTKVPK